MSMPSLSIIIPSYNGRSFLERCLNSVRAHAPRGTQVIVVDDASTDGTAEWLQQSHPWMELLSCKQNQGFCVAVNAGIERARGEIVELLNNDTEVRPGWAESALRHFADETVGSVAPLVTMMDQPEIIDSAGQEYHICGWARNRGYGHKLDQRYLSVCEVLGPSGSSGFYRREALVRAGGLVPEYGAYFEDVDLAFRLRWLGYRCVYEPGSRVLHKGSATYSRMPDRLVRLISRNEELVHWINLPRAELAKGLTPHLGFLLVRTVRKLIQGGLVPFLAGKYEALQMRAWILAQRNQLIAPSLQNSECVKPALSSSPDVFFQGISWLRRRAA